MAATAVSCPNCRAPLPDDPAALAALDRCPACGTRVKICLFPAFTAGPRSGALPEAVLAEGEAACFYHAGNKAVVPCDQCGRFLCALCDLELAGRHVCPVCLESGAKRGQVELLEHSRARPDLVVWNLLLLPLIACGYAFPLTALIALIYTLVKWNTKPSLVDNTRARLAWAIPVALLELAGGVALWLFYLRMVR